MKVFLVWERESFDNYNVIYISKTKEEAIHFLEKLTGLKYDINEPVEDYGHYSEPYTLDGKNHYWFIEEKEIGKHYKLDFER